MTSVTKGMGMIASTNISGALVEKCAKLGQKKGKRTNISKSVETFLLFFLDFTQKCCCFYLCQLERDTLVWSSCVCDFGYPAGNSVMFMPKQPWFVLYRRLDHHVLSPFLTEVLKSNSLFGIVTDRLLII